MILDYKLRPSRNIDNVLVITTVELRVTIVPRSFIRLSIVVRYDSSVVILLSAVIKLFYSSVVSSAPTILQPLVQNPNIPSTLFSFNIYQPGLPDDAGLIKMRFKKVLICFISISWKQLLTKVCRYGHTLGL